jgi:ubiquitin-like 1-activating enzyme E1 B
MYCADLAMRFVTAASNLRSSVFGIDPLQSLYSAKGIAGNIIPAIATTNAICAGLQILQCFAILRQQLTQGPDELNLKETCYYSNCIRNKTRNGLYLTSSFLESPNPNCFVCKNANIPLTLNTNEWTLEDFLKLIVKKRLGFEQPTIILGGDFIWEEGDGADAEEFQPNLKKALSKLPCGGIQHGTVVEIDDASQNLTIQVSVTHQDVWEGDEVDDHPFLVGAVPPKANKEESAAPPTAAGNGEATATSTASADDDDDIVYIIDDNDGDAKDNGDKKRPAEETNGEAPSKKAKVDSDPAVEVIEIE